MPGIVRRQARRGAAFDSRQAVGVGLGLTGTISTSREVWSTAFSRMVMAYSLWSLDHAVCMPGQLPHCERGGADSAGNTRP